MTRSGGSRVGLAAAAALVALVASGCVAPPPSVIVYGQESPSQFLELYRPSGPGPFPVVVWYHGGGLATGSRMELPAPFRDALLNRGYAVATVEYRLLAEATWPAAALDAKRAVRHLQEHAAELRLDPGRVVASGHSAGGLLAMMVALARNAPGQQLPGGDPALQGALTFAAPVDIARSMDDNPDLVPVVRQQLRCAPAPAPCDLTPVDPRTHLDSADPPLAMGDSTADKVITTWHTTQMREQADTAGYTKLTTKTIDGMPHELVNALWDPNDYLAWLDAVLPAPPTT